MSEFAQLLYALGIFINAFLAGLTYLSTRKGQQAISELEKNTNSIKDALVKVTAESEHAKGMLQGALEESKKITK
jgi:hypothetical protein